MRVGMAPGAFVVMLSAATLGAGASYAQSSEASFALPPREEFNAIVERPLFSPDRKPLMTETPVETESQPAAENGANGQLVLAGTATDQGNRAVAILHDVTQGTQYRVWVGDQVAGWTIEAIRPREIVLENAQGQVTVTLDEPALPKPPAGR